MDIQTGSSQYALKNIHFARKDSINTVENGGNLLQNIFQSIFSCGCINIGLVGEGLWMDYLLQQLLT